MRSKLILKYMPYLPCVRLLKKQYACYFVSNTTFDVLDVLESNLLPLQKYLGLCSYLRWYRRSDIGTSEAYVAICSFSLFILKCELNASNSVSHQLAEQVRLLLYYLGVEFEDKFYSNFIDSNKCERNL